MKRGINLHTFCIDSSVSKVANNGLDSQGILSSGADANFVLCHHTHFEFSTVGSKGSLEESGRACR
jgi:hypothetical protein